MQKGLLAAVGAGTPAVGVDAMPAKRSPILNNSRIAGQRTNGISPDEDAGEVLVLLQSLPQRRIVPARRTQVGALSAKDFYHIRQLLLDAQFQGGLPISRPGRGKCQFIMSKRGGERNLA